MVGEGRVKPIRLTAYGLTYAMALDNIVKQLPKEPNP